MQAVFFRACGLPGGRCPPWIRFRFLRNRKRYPPLVRTADEAAPLRRGQRCKSQVHAPTFTENFTRPAAAGLSCLFWRGQNTAGNCAHNVCAASRRDAKGTPKACLFSWIYEKLKFLILSIAPSHQFPFSVFASCKPPCPGIFFVSIPCIAAFFRRTEAAIKCNALRKDFFTIIRS